MAGAGYKLFNTGDVLTAAQVNTYLQEQTVMVFANSTARTTALSGVLAEGMMSYLQDTNAVEVYNGSSWVNVGNAGDLTEIVAGTGITVTSGTGPIPTVALTTPVAATNGGTAQSTYTTGDLLYASATNTLAKRAIGSTDQVLKVSGGIPTWAVDPTTDVVTTAGDLIYGTGADAVTRLGIGTAGQVLTVNSGATAPEWKTASGGGMTSLASGTLSGTSLDLTSISSAYNDLVLQIFDANWGTADDYLKVRFNNLSTGIYFTWTQGTNDGGGTAASYGAGSADRFLLWGGSSFLRTGENSIVLTIPNYAGSQNRKQLTGFLTYQNTVPNTSNSVWIGMADLSSAIDRITVSTQSNYTFSGGTYRLWGVK